MSGHILPCVQAVAASNKRGPRVIKAVNSQEESSCSVFNRFSYAKGVGILQRIHYSTCIFSGHLLPWTAKQSLLEPFIEDHTNGACGVAVSSAMKGRISGYGFSL